MTTTTLYKIIQSELINRGHNEFFDKDNRLVLFDSEQQFTTKILSFDDDIKVIINDLFHGLSLKGSDYDSHFKRYFLYRFINRQINRQTIETFKFELMSTFLMNQDYINRIYEDMDKYVLQTSTNEQTNKQLSKEISQQINQQVTTQLDERLNSENSSQDNTQDTTQNVKGNTVSDNRQARSDLPQNTVNLDVNNTVMRSANENDISKNKQTNDQDTKGLTKNNTTGENTGESTGRTESDSNSQTDGTADSETAGETNSLNKTYQLDELFKTHGVLDQVMNVFDVKCFLQFW